METTLRTRLINRHAREDSITDSDLDSTTMIGPSTPARRSSSSDNSPSGHYSRLDVQQSSHSPAEDNTPLFPKPVHVNGELPPLPTQYVMTCPPLSCTHAFSPLAHQTACTFLAWNQFDGHICATVFLTRHLRLSTLSHTPSSPRELQQRHVLQDAHRSSLSMHSDQSELSSAQSAVSSKATTPVDVESPRDTSGPKKRDIPNPMPRRQSFSHARPKLSIPDSLSPSEYAMECAIAADWSMLNAYSLHKDEYHLLRDHISHGQVTTYLNIRNGIIRLWVNNPQVAITRDEALGCCKDPRWFDVASLCFDLLVRRGHINFGCIKRRDVKPSQAEPPPDKLKGRKPQKTVVVIGAGLAGLGCARQLDSLFLQYATNFHDAGEDPPRIIVLEGRDRVGGRVYSRVIDSDCRPLSSFKGERFTAEMGGMIITGFERGNPLNIIVRGQLKLPYHELRPELVLYDVNGEAVDPARDNLVESLYNDCLDRVSQFKFKLPPPKLIEGNRSLMDEGRDSVGEGQKTIAQAEESTAALPNAPTVAEQSRAPQVDLVPVSTDRVTGRPNVEPGQPAAQKAARKARAMGWHLEPGVTDEHDLNLDTPSKALAATLGSVVDECISQYKNIVDLTPLDLRLLNWHIANLEYSNASNYRNLSLQCWDIDTGNEWDGKHTMIIGGYQNVARGLMLSPTRLDVRTKSAVIKIKYTSESPQGPAEVECEDGTVYRADCVVNTIPLGVLKQNTVRFEPEFPSWKQDAVDRLGFGVLNKVILVYEDMFWDPDKDFFGLLRNPTHPRSLSQKDYTRQRGRFFQWLNVSNTSGIPVLLALMAGDAAFDVEHTSNDDLVREATEALRSRFGHRVPYPRQALVSRWGSDRFARGSYSSAGPNMKFDDYDTMAKRLGNLYFAGEHTTGTHPATVHGAYLSGLRAASEVLDTMIGPLSVAPTAKPLITPKKSAHSLKRKAEQNDKDPKRACLEAWEESCDKFITSQIGPYPAPPPKVAGNAYLLFSKAHYEEARRRCCKLRRRGKSKPTPNEVRTMTSKMWKKALAGEKRPFEEEWARIKVGHKERVRKWEEAARLWNQEAKQLRKDFEERHPQKEGGDGTNAAGTSADINSPGPRDGGGLLSMESTTTTTTTTTNTVDGIGTVGGGGRGGRMRRVRVRMVESYAEESESDDDEEDGEEDGEDGEGEGDEKYGGYEGDEHEEDGLCGL